MRMENSIRDIERKIWKLENRAEELTDIVKQMKNEITSLSRIVTVNAITGLILALAILNLTWRLTM